MCTQDKEFDFSTQFGKHIDLLELESQDPDMPLKTFKISIKQFDKLKKEYLETRISDQKRSFFGLVESLPKGRYEIFLDEIVGGQTFTITHGTYTVE
jgi:hypothetical protein